MDTDIKLKNSPEDGISCVRFHPSEDQLLVTSWDKSLRLYNVLTNALLQKINQKAAILACCFLTPYKCATAGVQKRVFLTNLETSQTTSLGLHDSGIRCLEADAKAGLVFSGGWDQKLKTWDPRCIEPEVSCTSLLGKVFAMSVLDNFLVAGTSEKKIYIFDLKQPKMPLEVRDSALKQQIRCVKINTEESGFVSSSIEGRVSIEYFEPHNIKLGYTFKSHRVVDKATNTVRIFPVNAISFNPNYSTFATGGCDGVVNVWDGVNKKRICQLGKFPMSISALDFSSNGALLAVAVSYTWECGEQPHMNDFVQVHAVKDKEVRRKNN